MLLIPTSDHPFFRWQVITQIAAMEELGLLSDCRWLFYCNQRPSRQLQAIIDSGVAKLAVWPDWPRDNSYNGAMKPWLIGKYLQAHPKLIFDAHTVIDPDVIPTRVFHQMTPTRNIVYGTDTDSYTGPGYLKSKEVFDDLCQIVGVDPDYAAEFPGVGAQLTWSGLSGAWWQSVAKLSIEAYHFMNRHHSDVQKWCAEMYVTHLCLIRDGYIPTKALGMAMVWANGPAHQWDTAAFYHNAGVTEHNPNDFCKLDFKSTQPFGKAISTSPESASRKYVEYIRKAESRFPDLIQAGEGRE